jgi:hypothetical protein
MVGTERGKPESLGLLAVRPALVALLLATSGPPALGQSPPQPLGGMQFGIGYVANAPEAMAGASGYVVLPWWRGVGLYVDAKLDVSGPTTERGYEPGVTAAEIVGGQYRNVLIKEESSWRSVNAGLLRPVTPFLALYGGAGVARKTLFKLYQVDRGSGLGEGGVVWAEDSGSQETRLNLMTGLIMRLTSRVSSHFGFETQPRGLSVGLSLRLPRL